MKTILALLGLVILLSGCTQADSKAKEPDKIVKGTYGVAISRFDAFNPVISPKQTTDLILKLVNVGNTTASNIKISLINLGGLINSTSSNVTVSKLEARESYEQVWSIKAPDTRGLDFYPLIKICYDYSSVGYKSVKAIDNEIYAPETVLLPSNEGSTKGPISVSFEADNPVIIAEGSNLDLKVTFNNLDVGQVTTLSSSGEVVELANYAGKGDITIRIPSLKGRVVVPSIISDQDSNIAWTCKGVDEDSDGVIDYYECSNSDLKRFIGGKTLRTLFENLPIISQDPKDFDDVIFFEAEINYKYCLTTDPVRISVS